jgi:hypothetical protein
MPCQLLLSGWVRAETNKPTQKRASSTQAATALVPHCAPHESWTTSPSSLHGTLRLHSFGCGFSVVAGLAPGRHTAKPKDRQHLSPSTSTVAGRGTLAATCTWPPWLLWSRWFFWMHCPLPVEAV